MTSPTPRYTTSVPAAQPDADNAAPTAIEWARVCQSVGNAIRAEAWPIYSLPGWHDTTPMLSPNEHCNAVCDWHRLLLDFAVLHHIATRHPQQPQLVRINVTADPLNVGHTTAKEPI